MKRIRPPFLFIVLISLLLSCAKSEKAKTEEFPVNDLPVMTVVKLDNTPIDIKRLRGKTILILFFPDCDHCQRESKAIEQNIEAFKDYNLYFLSTAEREELEKFSKEYKLTGKVNIHFAIANVTDVLNNFGSVPAPSLYIYSDNGMRIKSFNGETAIEEILKAVK